MNESTFGYLYDTYSGVLYGIIVKAVPDRDVTGTVLQDVFVNNWRQLGNYDVSKGKFFSWPQSITCTSAVKVPRSGSNKPSQHPAHEYDNKFMDIYIIKSVT